MTMESNTVIGIFADQKLANTAIDDLNSLGYETKNMSILVRDMDWSRQVVKSKGERVTEGAAGGAGTGLALGAIAGLLVGIGAVTIPGIGAFFIGGPIAAALGLSGLAASTVTGATTGALAGGIVGALVGLGLPREVAQVYEERLKEGAVVIAVPVMTIEEQDQVEEVYREHNAEHVHIIEGAANQASRKAGMAASA